MAACTCNAPSAVAALRHERAPMPPACAPRPALQLRPLRPGEAAAGGSALCPVRRGVVDTEWASERDAWRGGRLLLQVQAYRSMQPSLGRDAALAEEGPAATRMGRRAQRRCSGRGHARWRSLEVLQDGSMQRELESLYRDVGPPSESASAREASGAEPPLFGDLLTDEELADVAARGEERFAGPSSHSPETLDDSLGSRGGAGGAADGESDGAEAWISSEQPMPVVAMERAGGRRVMELMAAWDTLAPRLPAVSARSSAAQLLIAALKLALPALQGAPPAEGGRSRTARALAMATTLADLRMDAETIAAGLLREAVEIGVISMGSVELHLGVLVGRLLHDSQRVQGAPQRVDNLDDATAKSLRQFCLSFHDPRSIVVELASCLDTMRHLVSLPRWRQQVVALETMQVWAPMAHALGTGSLLWELEDSAFRVLFPQSYRSMEEWLQMQWPAGERTVDACRHKLETALWANERLRDLVDGFSIVGRCKSLYSTMKKLLRDGRRRDEVFDLLGLRVVVSPRKGGSADEEEARGVQACYLVGQIATSLWVEIPDRSKDYIAKPKKNNYQSLHFAVHIDEERCSPPLELQIRTTAMDALAVHGAAAHGAYKGGLTDPKQVQQLRAIMEAMAELADMPFNDSRTMSDERMQTNLSDAETDHMFAMFDRNGDGSISMEEVHSVVAEVAVGLPNSSEDVEELMALLDANKDGSISAAEFAEFRRQIGVLRNLPGVDRRYWKELGDCLQHGVQINTFVGQGSERKELPLEQLARADHGQFEKTNCEANSSIVRAELVSIEEALQGELYSSNKELDGEAEPRGVESGCGREDNLPYSLPQGDPACRKDGGSCLVLAASVDAVVALPNIGGHAMALADDRAVREDGASDEMSVIAHPLMTEADYTDTGGGESSSVFSRLGFKSSGRLVLQRSPRPPTIAQPTLVQELELAREIASSPSEAMKRPIQEEQEIEEQVKRVRQLMKRRGDGLTQARALLQQLIREHPLNANMWVHYAQLERKSGNIQAARSRYEQSIQVFEYWRESGSRYIRALQAFATLEGHDGQADRARQLFKKALQIAQRTSGERSAEVVEAEVVGLHAWAMLEKRCGQWARARELLVRAERLRPRSAPVLHARALLEKAPHNWGLARTYFRRAAQAAPYDVVCWQAWGVMEAELGNVKRMRSLFRRALQVTPNNIHTLQAWAHHEGRMNTQEGWRKARQLYQHCVDVAPQAVYAWQAWALMEQRVGNLDEARRLLRRVLELAPADVACLQAYARLERQLHGNLQEARELLALALTAEPNNAAVLQETAEVEELLGHRETAKQLFIRAGLVDRAESRRRRDMFEKRKALAHRAFSVRSEPWDRLKGDLDGN